MTDIRYPNISAPTAQGQLEQVKSYLYQLAQQLNFALGRVSEGEVPVQRSAGTAEKEAQTEFSALKGLIIQSADIVNAYYTRISKRLEGEYVAQSAFGQYRESTAAQLSANSQSLGQLYEDLQVLAGQVQGMEAESLATRAWIQSGLLEYGADGAPVYGVEVGQRTQENGQEVFHRYARFTAGGIWFYLPSVPEPVAWMSGSKLYITQAEITDSLKLGGYLCDLSQGMAFQWMGGED